MSNIYTGIFLFGVFYTVITFLLGGLLGFIDAGFDTHFDAHFHFHVDHFDTAPTLTVSPLKPITIISFLTVFGGIGMMGTHYGLNPILVFILAFISAFIVSWMLFKGVVVPLYRAQSTSAISQEQLIGMTATIISTIIEGGYGTISYTVNGSRHNAPAKGVINQSIRQGKEVIITDIKDNLFYVQPVEQKYLE